MFPPLQVSKYLSAVLVFFILTTNALSLSKKYKVIGFDNNKIRINDLNNGKDINNEFSKKELKKAKVIHMSPKGVPLNECLVKKLLKEESLIILASRYEGVDERITQWIDEEISIGDYVLSGGELPAMVLMDTLIRHIPGALNDEESANQDSFADGLLDHPHYTRPEEYKGLKVPEVLMSGNHEKIRVWRLKESLKETWIKRPDLLAERLLTKEESRLLQDIKREQEQDSL